MAIKINDKRMCTGCGACANICPRQCITMMADDEGFLYPQVNMEECIQCGLCTKYCPVLHPICGGSNYEKKAYAAQSKNEDVRFRSTSGGAFSALASYVLSQNGYVCGAGYGEDNLVMHCIESTPEGLERLRQSKYVQSEIGTVYRELEKLLKQGIMVLFCGTPCQAAGFQNYLKTEYENLLLIDLICRGINSPKAYQYWLKELEEDENSKIVKVWFKYKAHGWKDSPQCTKIDFQNGNEKVLYRKGNTYMRGYLTANLFVRPSCSDCRFKGENRPSDITLADCWGADSTIDDDKGTSLIIVNSQKGEKFWKCAKDKMVYTEYDFKTIISNNISYYNSIKLNKRRKRFYKKLDHKKFSSLVMPYYYRAFMRAVIVGEFPRKLFFQILVQKIFRRNNHERHKK